MLKERLVYRNSMVGRAYGGFWWITLSFVDSLCSKCFGGLFVACGGVCLAFPCFSAVVGRVRLKMRVLNGNYR